jgi:hyperosmotically inducible protein
VIRRLLALVIVVGLVVAVLYYWRYRPGTPSLDAGNLDEVGRTVREGVGEVGQTLRDTKVTAAVKAALELNRTVEPHDVNVDTENGVVTLRGAVPDAGVSAEAEKVAAAVPDVRQVVNHLRIGEGSEAPPPGTQRTLGENLDDQKLEVQVRLAFSLNRQLKGSDIGVKAFRREVTLSGRVVNDAQRRAAVETAAQVPDVAGVVDQIQVGGAPAAETSPPPPGGAAAAAERALAAHPHLGGYGLEVKEEGGRLVVTGTVRSQVERELAGHLAGQAAKSEIENAIRVRP